MKMSDHGIPILPIQQKLDALAYCIKEDAFEDAAGHLCDLLAYCGNKIGSKFETLEQLVGYYGKHPAPIEPTMTKGATLAEAKAAKAKAKKQYKNASVGITTLEDGYGIKINFEENLTMKMPRAIDGVPVQVAAGLGKIKKQNG